MGKIVRILLKTVLILVLLLALYSLLQPLPWLGKISLYNRLFPGRERLPFGETPRTAYNFSLNQLDAMFAAHKISAAGEKDGETLRVLVIGDSASWGTLLRPEETLAGQLDGETVTLSGGTKRLEVYNLAYPTLSLSKDLLLLRRGLAFEPDLVIWALTMESFPLDKQLSTALVAANRTEFDAMAAEIGLSGVILPQAPEAEDFLAGTLIGQRRDLADLIRLQLYGFLWGATGIDQEYPADAPRPAYDFEADNTFHGVEGVYPDSEMAWQALTAAQTLLDGVPLLIINEPMLISSGKNSDIRYNFYYPRAAYDAWRASLHQICEANDWELLDLWDRLPAEEFSNSAIHMTADGVVRIKPNVLKTIEEQLFLGL